ncbi:Glyoxalase family protein [hydrothermal vent metagenome]|uniref:Glyoxalase family protein n=1 Tax=hydrothermal vent metagenome TaxID=652676 RepID=A0A3B0ZS47_9ZZZZ
MLSVVLSILLITEIGSYEVNKHEKINYVEFPAKDIQATKQFFSQIFGWSFEDFGPDYAAFSGQGVDGGFYTSELNSSTANGAALVVFYSQNLEATQAKIEAAGGIIVMPIFAFPGGRRFQFTEPSGNEFAVWSEK